MNENTMAAYMKVPGTWQ